MKGTEDNKKSESLVCLERSKRIHRQMANVNDSSVITNKKGFIWVDILEWVAIGSDFAAD